MTPLVSELVNGLRAGATAVRTVFRKPNSPSSQTMPVLDAMPMLTIKKTRRGSSRSRRKSSTSIRTKTKTALKSRGKARTKNTGQAVNSDQMSSLTVNVTPALDTCPSCGLQAPATLLAEHFSGSPSHRNGPEKVIPVDSTLVDSSTETNEEDSRQSVRNLLQILIPPRAFGLRHANRSISPISSIVKNLSTGPGRHR